MVALRLFAAVFVLVAVGAVGASAAFAGEITGSGKWIAGWLEWLPRLEHSEPKTQPEPGTASVPV